MSGRGSSSIFLVHVGGNVHVQLCARDSAVKTEHIVRGGLKVAGGIVRLGDEALVAGAIVDGLQQVRHRVESEQIK